MDHNLGESLTLEDMDFEHSEDVVNQDDIPLEQSGRLNSITMDMDDIGEQSHTLMETVNDDVIVSDLIEEPFPFQEYTIQSDGASGSNIMIDPNQLNQLTEHHDAVSGLQTMLEAPKQQPVSTLKYLNQQQEPMPRLQTILKTPAHYQSNMVTLKLAQPRATKRMVATAPPRQVAIAPKPVPTKTVQYAIAPKPVALVTNKQAVGSAKKVPISSEGKGSSVLAQIGRQLVMVPKKIKLMSSTSAEGVIAPSSTGVQYQMTCTPDQAQLIANTKGSKPMVKFIQLQGQSSAEQTTNPTMLTKLVTSNVPRARYVMQQKTVPISIGGNTVVQNFKIAGKKKIIAIKSQSPKLMPASQGNVATKKVVISSNNQKVLIRTTAPTSTTQVIKNTGSIGQHTQFHPINVPGKGIQYIKLVTNHPPQKATQKLAVPPKNFVFTDSKGNVIQMTAEKVEGQPSLVIPGAAPAVTKGLVKSVKGQKKLVRIAPVSKAVAQTISQPYRSSQSLLAPNTVAAPASTAQMTSLPSISSPAASTATEAVTLEEFNDMVEQNNEKIQQSLNHEKSLGQSYNYIDKSDYIDANDFSTGNDYSTAEEYSTAHEYSAEDASRLHEETVEEEIDPDETMDVKPTLQSLISDVVSDERGSVHGMDSMLEVEIGCEKKGDSIRDAPFMHRDDSNLDRDTNNASELNNEESIIIVPGTNYMQTQNESMYSDESYSYQNRRLSLEDHKEVPLLSVEAECHPYIDNQSQSPPPSEPDPSANLDMRPRKPCNCTKSQCLKLYCDCFANGEFCNSCNCNNCHNNLENEETRQKAIRSCLERNPNAFRPKIGKTKAGGPEIIRRHTKGCNCKRSGCLKNYCECYEAKIACTAMCKCVGCRNVEETLVRRRDAIRVREKLNDHTFRPAPIVGPVKQPCSFMTSEVIEAVCQCLIAAAGESDPQRADADPVQDVIEEFARCLQDVITASHHTL